MKARILTIIIYILMVVCLASCEDMMGDYLEKAPGVELDEEVVFSTIANAEKFLYSIYETGVHSNLGYGSGDVGYIAANPSGTLTSGATDESETCAAWYETQKWNTGSINPSSGEIDTRFSARWTAIRKVTVLMDRIYDVPDMQKEYADQLFAEAQVIRALNYFEMLKYYGGVPIIRERIQLDADLRIPRSSVGEVVAFILQDCEEAVGKLPMHQLGQLRGRVHQGVVHAIKSKTLLFAASPLFNSATPYLAFDNPANNKLVCLGDEDDSRWVEAAAAAKAALDWADDAGCILIEDQGEDKNYQYAWEKYDNMEIILASKCTATIGKWTWPWSAIAPPSLYSGNAGQSGITPTFNFVKKYETRAGVAQTWSDTGGDDLQAKMNELDYRFKQTIVGNMGRWNNEYPAVELFEGGRDVNTCHGGFWLHKHYPEAISEITWTYIPNSTIFQLNEIYLNYAEAMNEAYGPDDDHGYGLTARQAINKIRARSGQPAITTGNRDGFRERIRNERAIELAFDNHRWWDVRRWKIADQEGVMSGAMYGIKITKVNGSNTQFRYEPYVFETRTWSTKMYMHPFSTGEMNKGYLVQNPGY